MLAVVPVRVGTNTPAHGTISKVVFTMEAMASAAVFGGPCRKRERSSARRTGGTLRLRVGGNLCQHRYGLLRIFTDRRFTEKHDGIGSVEDSVRFAERLN